MLLALLEVMLFALGLTGAVAIAPYLLWTHVITTEAQMLQLMAASPVIVWLAAATYWRGYEAARVGLVRFGYYLAVPAFARSASRRARGTVPTARVRQTAAAALSLTLSLSTALPLLWLIP